MSDADLGNIPSADPNAFDLEAALLSLGGEQNPWDFLKKIQDQIPVSERHRFLDQFFLQCLTRPKAEQDSLLSSGREVFKYRMETARESMSRLVSDSAEQICVTPCVNREGILAEMIWNPESVTPLQFAVYKDGTVELAERVRIGTTTYIPPRSKLVEQGTIILPSGPAAYDDDTMLLMEIRDFIHDHVQIEDRIFQNIMAYYIMLSWIYDAFDVVPYIRASGDYGSGKTRLLQVMGQLSYRGVFAGGATTPSPLFRIIELYHGTLILDEADFEVSESWHEIVKILNTGYMRGFPVLRTERTDDGFNVQSYDTYSPKILATRHRWKDLALESRCLTYVMGAVQLRKDIPLILGKPFYARALAIRNKLLMWRFHNFYQATLDPTRRFDEFEPRMNQIILPILSCTRSERMQEEILKLVKDYQKRGEEERRESFEGQVAIAVVKRHTVNKTVLLKDVCEQLKHDNEGFKDLDSRKVSALIRRTFNIRVETRGGLTRVFANDEDIERLKTRYTLGPALDVYKT